MKSSNKIKIDRVVAGPLAFLLNYATRILGYLMRRDHRFPESPGVICVAKFTGLGSIVQVIPMLQAIKQQYPKTTLVFISSKNNSQLLERINFVDKSLYVSESSIVGIVTSTMTLIYRLWLLRPTLYFDLELYSYYASIIATMSLAINRLGFYRKSTRVKEGLFTHLVFFNTYMPVHQLYLQLARITGCKGSSGLATGTSIVVRDQDREEVTRVLGKWPQDNGKMLVVNPNASDLCLERRWPGDRFVEVIIQLLDQINNLQVALTGSPAERNYVSLIHSQLFRYGERVRNFAGELSLGGFLALLERTDCFLTNDSGPMHMAFALVRPTVAMFGPGHPMHYAAYSEFSKTVVLYEPILCSPCLYHSDFTLCSGDNQCMKLIESSTVSTACLAMLISSEVLSTSSFPQRWAPPQEFPKVNSPDGVLLGKVILRYPVD
jgi:ADP-heptose:LPS heptosyltransferase